MVIGMTYDLKSAYMSEGYSAEAVAEFDCEQTLDAIEKVLKNNGHSIDRIGNIKHLVARLSKGDRWDLVFNIAEGMNGIGREAQIPALLDAYDIPFTFSSTEVLAVALDKGLTNAVMNTYGVRTARFQVVRKIKDIQKVKIPFPLFVKPLAEGTSKGINKFSRVDSYEVLEEQCKYILSTFHQPALVEEYLPGREFTVGILGSGDEAKVLGVLEITFFNNSDKNAYTYDNKKLYEDRVQYTLVDEPQVAKLALKAWQSLHGLDAGRVDIRMNSENKPCFMEVNPMAGLNPEYSDLCILCRHLGFPYENLITRILHSASERAKKRL